MSLFPLRYPYFRQVRFRADPSKIRVSIRRAERDGAKTWVVWVTDKGGAGYLAIHPDPVQALEEALAQAADMPGVDLLCKNKYPHPQIERAK